MKDEKKGAFEEVQDLREENEELTKKYDNVMRELCEAAWDEVILKETIVSLKTANDSMQENLQALTSENGLLSNRMWDLDAGSKPDEKSFFVPIKRSEIKALVIADQMELDKGLTGLLSDDLSKVFGVLLEKDDETPQDEDSIESDKKED